MHAKVIEKTKYSSFSATFVNLGFAAGYLVTFAWGVFELQRDAITYGVLLAFIQLVGQIQGPLRALSGYVPTFINAATACERLMELEQMPADRAAMKRALATPTSVDKGRAFAAHCAHGTAIQSRHLSLHAHFAYRIA